jgi:hypothetical protein
MVKELNRLDASGSDKRFFGEEIKGLRETLGAIQIFNARKIPIENMVDFMQKSNLMKRIVVQLQFYASRGQNTAAMALLNSVKNPKVLYNKEVELGFTKALYEEAQRQGMVDAAGLVKANFNIRSNGQRFFTPGATKGTWQQILGRGTMEAAQRTGINKLTPEGLPKSSESKATPDQIYPTQPQQ